MMLNRLKKLILFLFLFEIFIVSQSSGFSKFDNLYDSAKKHRSISIAALALESAKTLDDEALIAKAYFLMAYYQRHEFMYYESLNNYFSSLEYYRKSGNVARQVDALASVGIIYTNGGFYNKAIMFYQDGIELSLNTKDLERELSLSYQVAKTYRLLGENELAKTLLNELIPRFKQIENENFVSQCYLELGFISAVEGVNYDSTDYYYTQAVNAISEESENKKQAFLKRMYSLAYMFIQKDSFDEAKRLLITALDQSGDGVNYREVLTDIYGNLGDVYHETNMADSAVYYYEEAMSLGNIKEFKTDYLHRAKYLYDYYKIKEASKSDDYGAIIFQFADQLTEFKQNLQEANNKYQIAAANYKRETELIYAQQRDRMILNAILYISLGLIMLTGLIYYLYERRKRVTKWRKVLNELTIKPGITSYP